MYRVQCACMSYYLAGPLDIFWNGKCRDRTHFVCPFACFCIFMKLTTKSFMMIVFFFNLYFWIIQIISFKYFRLTGLIKNWILYHVWQLMCTENFYFHPDKIPIPKFWTFKKFPNIWQVLGGLFTHLPPPPPPQDDHQSHHPGVPLSKGGVKGSALSPRHSLLLLSKSRTPPHQTV